MDPFKVANTVSACSKSNSVQENVTDGRPPLWAAEILISSDSEYSSDDSPPNEDDIDFVVITNDTPDSEDYMDVDSDSGEYEPWYWDYVGEQLAIHEEANMWVPPVDNTPDDIFDVWQNRWMTAAELRDHNSGKKRSRDSAFTAAEQHHAEDIGPSKKRRFQ